MGMGDEHIGEHCLPVLHMCPYNLELSVVAEQQTDGPKITIPILSIHQGQADVYKATFGTTSMWRKLVTTDTISVCPSAAITKLKSK